jgi:hypothetical protein
LWERQGKERETRDTDTREGEERSGGRKGWGEEKREGRKMQNSVVERKRLEIEESTNKWCYCMPCRCDYCQCRASMLGKQTEDAT